MQDSKLYAASVNILGPTGAYIGSIGSTGHSLTINPIQGGTGQIGYLTYNNTSGEITYNTDPLTLSRGKTLVVDSVNGNDTTAGIYPYRYPFKTVSAAITASVSGDTVYIYPGQYEESITVKTGIAVRGINVQTVSIQKTNVLTDTTLATMSSNCRLEDVTLNLTGATGGITLTGVNFTANSATTGKLRTAVVNVSNYNPQPSIAYGVLSNGITDTSTYITSSNSVRASTINVNLGSTGSTGIGVFVNTNNNFSCRDTNIFANGPTGYTGNTGTYIVGASVDVPNGNAGYLQLNTCTLSGATYDIARPSNDLVLTGFTNLVHSTTDGNSFSVATQPNIISYLLKGNFTGTHYMVPGSLPFNDAPNTPYSIPIDQNMVIIGYNLQYTGTISNTDTITINVCKNNIDTILQTYTFNSTNYTTPAKITNKSATFLSTDSLIIEVVVSGTINNSILLVQLTQY